MRFPRTSSRIVVNEVAICLTKAKTRPPSLGRLKSRISELRREFDPKPWKKPAAEADEFFQHAYAPGTLKQLLYLRQTLDWRQSRVDNMLAALTLGSLHGEATSKRYLSNQMPRTISTKPRYSVNFWKMHQLVAPERDVFAVLGEMAAFRYESPMPEGDSIVLHMDMRNLPRVIEIYAETADTLRHYVTAIPQCDQLRGRPMASPMVPRGPFLSQKRGRLTRRPSWNGR